MKQKRRKKQCTKTLPRVSVRPGVIFNIDVYLTHRCITPYERVSVCVCACVWCCKRRPKGVCFYLFFCPFGWAFRFVRVGKLRKRTLRIGPPGGDLVAIFVLSSFGPNRCITHVQGKNARRPHDVIGDPWPKRPAERSSALHLSPTYVSNITLTLGTARLGALIVQLH